MKCITIVCKFDGDVLYFNFVSEERKKKNIHEVEESHGEIEYTKAAWSVMEVKLRKKKMKRKEIERGRLLKVENLYKPAVRGQW